ncbi:MAG TPA: 5-formyltetrahydrofolate cyclo-ligase [Clostridia bacterium]|nr:5-formyltetrahydrofolate cyclo-ligase [Clostridia bacterium]
MTLASVPDKQAYRREAKARIAGLTPEQKHSYSALACANLLWLPEFLQARTILAYRPVRGECAPDVLVRIARGQGVRVAFPLCVEGNALALYLACSEEDFRPGAYGIAEPNPTRCARVAPQEIDFAVIPGLAFDAACNRLGRGAGYYDRFLAAFGGIKAGLAYDCQIFPAIPADEHDVGMDFVATNNGIIVKNQQ